MIHVVSFNADRNKTKMEHMVIRIFLEKSLYILGVSCAVYLNMITKQSTNIILICSCNESFKRNRSKKLLQTLMVLRVVQKHLLENLLLSIGSRNR